MWNCPLCASENSTMVCSCGYDKSRDHALYPTFVPLPAGTPSAVGISAEPEPRMAVVKCPDCGLEAVIYEDQFHPTCKKCENTPLNPTDHVRIYRSVFRRFLSGKQDINPYSLYSVSA